MGDGRTITPSKRPVLGWVYRKLGIGSPVYIQPTDFGSRFESDLWAGLRPGPVPAPPPPTRLSLAGHHRRSLSTERVKRRPQSSRMSDALSCVSARRPTWLRLGFFRVYFIFVFLASIFFPSNMLSTDMWCRYGRFRPVCNGRQRSRGIRSSSAQVWLTWSLVPSEHWKTVKDPKIRHWNGMKK